MMTRRRFGAAALFTALTPRRGLPATEDARLNIRTDSVIGTIRPELHGQFAEHLGSCIYGGVWVGKNSKIPNINGYRRDAVEYLKALGIPVLRWPGGCFADDYHWRDGIGPLAKRPRRVNIWWGYYTEDNSFGTHEFIELCRMIGSEPYLAGNVGSGTPQELRDWVEYCNFPSGSTLSDERIANGARQPFNVKYWGIGNENWGCGGNMTPEEYCANYRRYATYVTSRAESFGAQKLFLVACGPSGNNLDWTRRFFDTLGGRKRPDGYAMHFYSRGKDFATRFTPEIAREQFATFEAMEKAIGEQRELMDKYDPKRQIGLMIDEWGVWDRMNPEEEKKYGRLWQQITMRSAISGALGLNVFHRQADKLVMCNIAQTVNVLHAILLTEGNRTIRTSTYYVFQLLKPHLGRESVRVEGGLSTSASVKGKELVLTLVNPKHDTGIKVDASLTGAKALAAQARILHDPDLNACNTFENPDRLAPKDHPVSAEGARVRIELPPLSIATARVALA
ncbi:MAG: alpha-N-arabinofuranosidase [Bryobacteraceae bacterium]